MSEIESDGKTINDYKKMINMIIDWVSEGKDVKLDNFPYNLRRLMAILDINELKTRLKSLILNFFGKYGLLGAILSIQNNYQIKPVVNKSLNLIVAIGLK